MKRLIAVVVLALAACRGEPVPRDYQNAPPAMTHPATTSSQTPTAEGMGQVRPEPTTAVEGTAGPYQTTTETAPKTTTTSDRPPVTTTT